MRALIQRAAGASVAADGRVIGEIGPGLVVFVCAMKGDGEAESAWLARKTVAILVTDGFEQAELVKPREALEAAGAKTVVVSPATGFLQGYHHHEKADLLPVDLKLDRADPAKFDALLLPGGAMNPDALRLDPAAVAFVRAFAEANKPVAAICHGPWTL